MRILGFALLPLAATLASAQTPEFTGPVTLGWQSSLGATGDTVSVYEIALSPDADTVFTCGTTVLAAGETFLQAAAFGGETGALHWVKNLSGTASYAWGGALAVAPDGSRVYVSGAQVPTTWEDLLVVALDAESGAEKWTRTWDGSAGLDDWAGDLVVSPDGSRVYVAGSTTPTSPGDPDILLLALDATTGGVQWSQTWDSAGHFDQGVGVGVTPDGAAVFVAGTTFTGEVCDASGCETEVDIVALAYAAADGAPIWSAILNATSGPASTDVVQERALGLALDTKAERVLVWGMSSPVAGSTLEGLAAAFAMGDGAELWRSTVSAPGAVSFFPTAFGLHAGSGVAYLAGSAFLNDPLGLHNDVGAVALDSGDGAVVWVVTHGTPGKDDVPRALAVRADGAELALACGLGETGAYDADLGVLGLDASSGGLRWSARLDGTLLSSSSDEGSAIVGAPDARRWFVAGRLPQSDAPPGVLLALDRPFLWGDPSGLSVSAGGLHDLLLDPGPAHAGDLYLVLGSLSGTEPGIHAPPVLLPLNWDVYLEFTLANPSSAYLPHTFGTVDPDGTAAAALLLPASAPPSLVGQIAHHAYVVFDELTDFQLLLASNPTALELLP